MTSSGVCSPMNWSSIDYDRRASYDCRISARSSVAYPHRLQAIGQDVVRASGVLSLMKVWYLRTQVAYVHVGRYSSDFRH